MNKRLHVVPTVRMKMGEGDYLFIKGLCTVLRSAAAADRHPSGKDLSGLACRAVHGSGEFPRGVATELHERPSRCAELVRQIFFKLCAYIRIII